MPRSRAPGRVRAGGSPARSSAVAGTRATSPTPWLEGVLRWPPVFQLDGVAVEVGGREFSRRLLLRLRGERWSWWGGTVAGRPRSSGARGLGLRRPGVGRYGDRSLDAASLDDGPSPPLPRRGGLLFHNVDAMLFTRPCRRDRLRAPGSRARGRRPAPARWRRCSRWAPLLGRRPSSSPGARRSGGARRVLAITRGCFLLDEATAKPRPASSALLVDLLAARGRDHGGGDPQPRMAESWEPRRAARPGRSGRPLDGRPTTCSRRGVCW